MGAYFRTRTKFMAWRLASLVSVLSVVVLLGNQFVAQRQMRQVLERAELSSVVMMDARFRQYVNPSQLVLDLRGLADVATPSDVVRVLIKYAQAQREKRFERVYLAHRGVEKFWLSGEDFSRLGVQALAHDPVVMLKTLPSYLHRLDGSKAFEAPPASPLHDMARQLEHYRSMHEQWYLHDLRLEGV
jgi:hypothetical protein